MFFRTERLNVQKIIMYISIRRKACKEYVKFGKIIISGERKCMGGVLRRTSYTGNGSSSECVCVRVCNTKILKTLYYYVELGQISLLLCQQPQLTPSISIWPLLGSGEGKFKRTLRLVTKEQGNFKRIIDAAGRQTEAIAWQRL